MAVPQDALPLHRELGRKGNAVRIRRNIYVDVRWFCGTVITVPYKGIEKARCTGVNACIDLFSNL